MPWNGHADCPVIITASTGSAHPRTELHTRGRCGDIGAATHAGAADDLRRTATGNGREARRFRWAEALKESDVESLR
jgi:hypothetical protein